LTESGDSIVTENVATKGFRASRRGNALINARVMLPSPCIAPIVFIAPGDENYWFAVTGAET